MNCVYKPCPGALYSAPQSCCSILSHDALHHCLSSNSSLENSEGELGHLSRYYRNCKNTSRIVFRERIYPATGISRVHYLKSGYIIQLGLACETRAELDFMHKLWLYIHHFLIQGTKAKHPGISERVTFSLVVRCLATSNIYVSRHSANSNFLPHWFEDSSLFP